MPSSCTTTAMKSVRLGKRARSAVLIEWRGLHVGDGQLPQLAVPSAIRECWQATSRRNPHRHAHGEADIGSHRVHLWSTRLAQRQRFVHLSLERGTVHLWSDVCRMRSCRALSCLYTNKYMCSPGSRSLDACTRTIARIYIYRACTLASRSSHPRTATRSHTMGPCGWAPFPHIPRYIHSNMASYSLTCTILLKSPILAISWTKITKISPDLLPW
jgi:hypothetical protein